LIVHRAAWVLPVAAPPIRDGWVAVERGLIVGCGGPDDPPPAGTRGLSEDAQSGSREDPPVAGGHVPEQRVILPALVNAHTHLELSWLAGAVPPAEAMPLWAERLIAARGSAVRDPVEPIIAAIAECRASGTALVGDVTNTLAAYEPIADSLLSACVFREVLGFRSDDPASIVAAVRNQLEGLTPSARLRPSIVPHAPYSVSPRLLAEVAGASGGRIVSVHLGESADECEFLAEGTGRWRALLERLGAWNSAWVPPACGPVQYLARFGLVNDRLLAVHGVYLEDRELELLAAAGATVVACPRSNRWTGSGDPPIERFYGAGVRVAVGTDSLASVADLNVFQELAAMRALAPRVPARHLLETATRSGADALGFGDELGTIAAGKRAELISVALLPDTTDVEEYLVSGIRQDAVRWLDGD
jgi:aminodeoxyfutalosine deaminase